MRSIDLIRELELRGLLLRVVKKRGRGRPQHSLRTTALGEEFIDRYNRLLNLRTRSNRNDIKRALEQADLALRLTNQGVSLYARFLEVNEIARNIARTPKTRPDSR